MRVVWSSNTGKLPRTLLVSCAVLAVLVGGLIGYTPVNVFQQTTSDSTLLLVLVLALPVLLLCLLMILAEPSWGLVALLLFFYNPATIYTLLNVSEWSYFLTFGICGGMAFSLAIGSMKSVVSQPYPTWWRRIYLALFVYVMSAALSALYGLLIGNELRYVVSDFLQLFEFAVLYWLTTQILWRSGRVWRIVTWAFVFFLLTLLWELAVYYGVAPPLSWGTTASFEASVGGELVGRGISNAPFLFFPVILAVVLIAGARISSKVRLLLYLSLFLAGLSVLLSFTRSFWMGLLVASFFLLFAGRKLNKAKVLLRFAVVLLVAIVILSLVPLQGKSLSNWLVSRMAYTLPQIADESNLGRASRLLEYDTAWNVMQTSPILGAGLGSKYVGYIAGVGQLALKHYMHNFYLAVIFRMGVIGLATVGWCLTMIFLAILRRIRDIRDVKERSLVVGLLASFLALAVQAVTFRSLLSHPLSAYVGFGLGLATYLSTDRSAIRAQRKECVSAPVGQTEK